MKKNIKEKFTKTNVVGTTFEGRQEKIKQLKELTNKEKVSLILEHEEDNKYDSNAIKVIAKHKNGKQHIGYISKNLNETLLNAVKENEYDIPEFYIVGGDDEFNYGVELSIVYKGNE